MTEVDDGILVVVGAVSSGLLHPVAIAAANTAVQIKVFIPEYTGFRSMCVSSHLAQGSGTQVAGNLRAPNLDRRLITELGVKGQEGVPVGGQVISLPADS
ncbi:hypothetical protein JOJ87_005200 [Rhodococcus ruber]|uniref:hypothetical protein n=1 Tax=Rhodococcus ruber TaxID=1830 RepID=UPI001AEB7BDE|nr:hypothetical protein [Rhodococcus ruber]MBP2214788.1 hypothetical protein [Rhodococcus ruber]